MDLNPGIGNAIWICACPISMHDLSRGFLLRTQSIWKSDEVCRFSIHVGGTSSSFLLVKSDVVLVVTVVAIVGQNSEIFYRIHKIKAFLLNALKCILEVDRLCKKP